MMKQLTTETNKMKQLQTNKKFILDCLDLDKCSFDRETIDRQRCANEIRSFCWQPLLPKKKLKLIFNIN